MKDLQSKWGRSAQFRTAMWVSVLMVSGAMPTVANVAPAMDDIVFGTAGGYVYGYNSALTDKVFDQTNAFGVLADIVARGDNKYVLAGSAGTLYLCNSDLSVSTSVAVGSMSDIAQAMKNGTIIGTADGYGLFRDNALNAISSRGDYGSNPRVASLQNGNYIVASSDNGGQAYIVAASNSEPIYGGIPGYRSIVAVYEMGDGNIVVVGYEAGTTFVWVRDSQLNHLRYAALNMGTSPTTAMTWDDKLIFGTAQGNVFVYDLITMAAVASKVNAYGNITRVGALSNGNIVIASDASGGKVWLVNSSLTTIRSLVIGSSIVALDVRSDPSGRVEAPALPRTGNVLGDSASFMVLSAQGTIAQISDVANGVAAKSAPNAYAWRMRLSDGSYRYSTSYSTPTKTTSTNQYSFTWTKSGWPTVTLRYSFDPATGEYRAAPTVQAYSSSVIIVEFEFPNALEYDNRDENNYLIGSGTDIATGTSDELKPLRNILDLSLSYPGIMQMQMLGFKVGNSSLLTYTNDTNSRIKWNNLTRSGHRLKQQLRGYIKLPSGTAWNEEYSMIYRVFPSGGITELAQGYARWARGQVWASEKVADKLERCPLLDRYIYDGCVRMNGMPSQDQYVQQPDQLDGEWIYTGSIMDYYTEVLGEMDGFEASGVFPGYWWPTWSGHRFDTAYPDYFPVKSFMGDFSAFRQALIDQDRPMMYHLDTAIWAQRNPSFRLDWAATWYGGRWSQIWSNTTHYLMSPGLTLNRELQTIAQIKDSVGVNGIYLDVIGAGFATDDNASSPYASLPNCFQAARNASIAAVRQEVSGPVMTEGRSEGYLSAIDIGFGYLGNLENDPVPLWQIVYGDCALLMPYIDRYPFAEYTNQICSWGGILALPPGPGSNESQELSWRQRVLSEVVGKRMIRYDRQTDFRISQWDDGTVIWLRPEAAGTVSQFSLVTADNDTISLENNVSPNGILVLMDSGNLIASGIGRVKINGTVYFETDETTLTFIKVDNQLMICNSGVTQKSVNYSLGGVSNSVTIPAQSHVIVAQCAVNTTHHIQEDFSNVQGQNGWYYGYVTGPSTLSNPVTSPTITYDPSGFIPLNTYGTIPPGNGWLLSGHPDLWIGQSRAEPFSDGTQEYRTVTRWVVPDNGVINKIEGYFTRPSSYSAGYGVVVGVTINGRQIDAAYVEPTTTYTYHLTNSGAGYAVSAGDKIDLVISPQGVASNAYHGDYTDYDATITFTQTTSNVEENFSGVQGQYGWYYGYATGSSTLGNGDLSYEKTKFVKYDTYGPVPGGTGWYWSANPDLFTRSSRMEPYSDGVREYRAITRWTVPVSGQVSNITGYFIRPSSYSTGNGVIVGITINGQQLDSHYVAPMGTYNYNLTNNGEGWRVFPGDKIDIIVSPQGIAATSYHGDYTDFDVTINLVPSGLQENIPGDANGDSQVDVGDLGILAANYGGSNKTRLQGDFNNDGVVDVGDLGILAANYGTGINTSQDFAADYAKVFDAAIEDDADDAEETALSICSGLGLPLVVGLGLMGLMLEKLKEGGEN